jgi:TIR domain
MGAGEYFRVCFLWHGVHHREGLECPMGEGALSDDGAAGPYFFLSYRQIDHVGKEPPNRFVVDFYHDLCGHFMQLTDHPNGVPVGFMDHDIPAGTRWSDDIMYALARCRVFVPLYQPKFFRSPWCGMEWDAFTRRERRASRRHSPFTAIFPVLWAPVDPQAIPKIASELQIHDAIGDDYRREGLYRLAVMKDFHNGYMRATLEIATAIIKVATTTRLEPCEPDLFTDLRNVFDE